MRRKILKESPKVLGLDVSTQTIGWALFDIQTKQLLELTHISPRTKIKTEDKIEELLLKSEVFKTKIEQYKNLGITKVIIEEPLLNSNNVYTIGTLMRYNTLITKQIYDTLGLVPEFISTYNSRKFAFPELVQENDKKKFVLFGGLPKDIDKKMIIWEKVAKFRTSNSLDLH
jgi:RNase H-fold protein (predicted Holliday junction resolvase)